MIFNVYWKLIKKYYTSFSSESRVLYQHYVLLILIILENLESFIFKSGILLYAVSRNIFFKSPDANVVTLLHLQTIESTISLQARSRS